MKKKKVYIVMEDWEKYDETSKDYDVSSDVFAVFSDADKAKEFINKQPEFYDSWKILIDKDGWIVKAEKDNETYRYRVVEEEVK